MTMIQQSLSIEGVELMLTPDARHEYLMTTEQVALGYGVGEEAIRSHKARRTDELLEGKHWVVANSNTPGGVQSITLWTKRGIVRLGFFIRSARARKFRDMAEDLVIGELEKPNTPALISAAQIGLSTGQTRNAAGKYVNSFGVHPVAYYHEESRKQVVHLFELAAVERVYAERQYPLRTPFAAHRGPAIQGQPPRPALKVAPAQRPLSTQLTPIQQMGADLAQQIVDDFVRDELPRRFKALFGSQVSA